MILFKPYVDLCKKKVDNVWVYSLNVTISTNVPIVGAIELYEAFENAANDGLFEVTLKIELEPATPAWKAEHVFFHSAKIELGEISFCSSSPALKVLLVDATELVNLGGVITHQDDAEEEGMPGKINPERKTNSERLQLKQIERQ
jgi:hypothetical protein